MLVDVRRGGKDAGALQVRDADAGPSTLCVRFPEDRVVYPGGGFHGHMTVCTDLDGRFGDRADGTGPRRSVVISDRGPDSDAHADLDVRGPRENTF